MDAITLLKDDHRAVAKLFKEFDGLGVGAVKTKEVLAGRVIEELTVHAHVEEAVFYPFVRQQMPNVVADVEEGIAEHHLITITMAEIEKLSVESDEFGAKFKVLKELVEHHVEEEEHGWFPKVREAIGRNDLSDLGEHMTAAKVDAPREPVPG